MKETIQMANNCLYSLPCLNNENDVCYDLKQNLDYGRAIKKKKSLYLGTKQSRSGRRQLLLELSKAQLFLLTLLCTFLCPRLEKRPQEKTENFLSPECMHIWVPLQFQIGSLFAIWYGNIKSELAYDQQRLTSFFKEQWLKLAVGLHLWQQDLN